MAVRDIRRIYQGGGGFDEPPDVAKFRAAARANFRGFMSRHLYIRTKEATIATLVPNWSQTQVLNAIEEDEKAGIPVRHIYLKSRRVGISTIHSGRIFGRCYTHNNREGLIMAHLADVTQNLFRMQHLFLKCLPDAVRLPLKRSNKKELVWDAINSQISLLTAGSTHGSRSMTLHDVLCSEAPFYPDLMVLRGALEACVPELAGTSLIWEGTAFGAGTEFHDMWLAAVAGDIYYKAKFLEWYKDSECQAPEFPNQKVQDAVLEELFSKFPDLKERQKHFQLTARQIAWYGSILRNKYSGNMLLMMQEFPCTAEEAFLASGTPVFPQLLFEKYKNATRPGTRYEVTPSFQNLKDATKNEFIRHEDKEHTYFEIWDEPREGRHYLISADPARGIVGGDYSAACIFDIATRNLVGVVHGKLDLRQFSIVLRKLAKLYNHAVIMPEVTGIGAGLLSHLTEDYYHIYQQRKDDSYTIEVTNKLGWETSTTSRLKMVGTARNLFIERAASKPGRFIPCKALVDEITTFVTGNLNKPEAAENCHDDLVIAWAMGLQGCEDELKTRPDIARTISSSKSDTEESATWTPQDTIAMLKDPNFIPGQTYKPQDPAISGPFIPPDQIEEEEEW